MVHSYFQFPSRSCLPVTGRRPPCRGTGSSPGRRPGTRRCWGATFAWGALLPPAAGPCTLYWVWLSCWASSTPTATAPDPPREIGAVALQTHLQSLDKFNCEFSIKYLLTILTYLINYAISMGYCPNSVKLCNEKGMNFRLILKTYIVQTIITLMWVLIPRSTSFLFVM